LDPRVTATAQQTGDERSRLLAAAPESVVARGVGKRFVLPHQRYSTLKERVLHPFAGRDADEFEALRDVNLAVKQGEFFGIVGRNGSGKSTLLKCLAGIYALDAGEIVVNGRLSPFIELGVGFNQELSARDNVLINAIMLGLSRREARARFDEIIEFAELEEFVDLKLKNYSSGMSVRLGFSVAIQVEAEVLLVDEVLAVGDAAFQQKCFDAFDDLKSKNRTILYVTHDMGSIERFCDRGLVLERGGVVDEGHPEQITRTYNEINFGQLGSGTVVADSGPTVRFLRCWCESPAGEQLVTSRQGDQVEACIEVEFLRPVEDPTFNIIFRNEVRHSILVLTTEKREPGGSYAAGERALVRFAFENRLAQSRYTLTAAVGAEMRGHSVHGQAADLSALVVQAPHVTGGVIELPYDVEVERG
jgi:ABC-type polysaccharide/polyol phosphate transport system ATPase subunit